MLVYAGCLEERKGVEVELNSECKQTNSEVTANGHRLSSVPPLGLGGFWGAWPLNRDPRVADPPGGVEQAAIGQSAMASDGLTQEWGPDVSVCWPWASRSAVQKIVDIFLDSREKIVQLDHHLDPSTHWLPFFPPGPAVSFGVSHRIPLLIHPIGPFFLPGDHQAFPSSVRTIARLAAALFVRTNPPPLGITTSFTYALLSNPLRNHGDRDPRSRLSCSGYVHPPPGSVIVLPPLPLHALTDIGPCQQTSQ